ncbi:hypothetical protein [Streptosporangium sp. NPDC023615]|uniref:hypothetical protein n=1 Tax=Streptosporangium sp. NPDC023615 TaxID=3154794 RepID=UPI0034482508
MSARSRSWWAAAVVLAAAGMWAMLTRSGGSLEPLWQAWLCSGLGVDLGMWTETLRWRTPLRYAAVCALLLALGAHLLSVGRGREPVGRTVVRVLMAAVLLVHGSGALTLLLKTGTGDYCLLVREEPAFLRGTSAVLNVEVALVLAALCALAAVRVPRHRVRRLVRSRRFRRVAVGTAAGGLLCLLPAADLGSGPVTGLDACGPGDPLSRRGESAFLCNARLTFPTMPDHDLLAYGRRECATYPDIRVELALIVPICPPAARRWDAELAAEEAELDRRDAANQAACDASRHRPLTTPVGVRRELLWSEIGLEVYEDHEAATEEEPALHHDVVASAPGHLRIGVASDSRICLTTETYRGRPPVEVKGWDKVIEVGYESPTGDAVIWVPMSGPSRTSNLAFLGRGHYRLRVHYREPVWDRDLPQHILVMAFPGKSERVVAHRR